MSATADSPLHELERAIMARADELAQGFHDKAKRQRDTILRDAAERLHLAEEREVLIAKAEAERHFRRVTQASELKMQGRLDQLRWEMVQTVQNRLSEKMQAMREDHGAYRGWLAAMIADAVQHLPEGDLTADACASDLPWLTTFWDELVAEAAPGRNIALDGQPAPGSGGIRLHTQDNGAQVDNRFEGRLSRYEARIQRVILNQLFPTDINVSARSGGPQ